MIAAADDRFGAKVLAKLLGGDFHAPFHAERRVDRPAPTGRQLWKRRRRQLLKIDRQAFDQIARLSRSGVQFRENVRRNLAAASGRLRRFPGRTDRPPASGIRMAFPHGGPFEVNENSSGAGTLTDTSSCA